MRPTAAASINGLPALLILTDRLQARRALVDVVRAALDGGARGFVVREKDLPRAQRVELAQSLAEPIRAAGGLLLGADDDLDLCDGVHLSVAAAAAGTRRQGRRGIVGCSCHHLEELEAATDVGADYVTLSPIFPTASKPGYGPPLGTDGLARLAASGPPLYALGGIDAPARAARCIAAGAAGVAVMGAVMRATDPRQLVEGLVAAVEGVPA